MITSYDHSDHKAHLTSQSRMFDSRWMITPSWLSGSLRSFLYSSSVYSCHLLLISSVSVRSVHPEIPNMSLNFLYIRTKKNNYFVWVIYFEFLSHWIKPSLKWYSVYASIHLTSKWRSSQHFMANRWGNNGNSDRLYFLGSKITVDSDCSLEIKRPLLLGRKSMTNLNSILKSRDITLPTIVHIVKAMIFPVLMYRCESWTIKKTEHLTNDAFKLWW